MPATPPWSAWKRTARSKLCRVISSWALDRKASLSSSNAVASALASKARTLSSRLGSRSGRGSGRWVGDVRSGSAPRWETNPRAVTAVQISASQVGDAVAKRRASEASSLTCASQRAPLTVSGRWLRSASGRTAATRSDAEAHTLRRRMAEMSRGSHPERRASVSGSTRAVATRAVTNAHQAAPASRSVNSASTEAGSRPSQLAWAASSSMMSTRYEGSVCCPVAPPHVYPAANLAVLVCSRASRRCLLVRRRSLFRMPMERC